MNATTFWLTEETVSRLVPLEDAIDALESSLIEIADGVALNVPKALGDIGKGGVMHCLGSAMPRVGVCGFKTWAHTKQGAKAVFALFSTENGSLLAMMEANTLGQLRTAAMTAVGTRHLVTNTTANDLAVVGSGKQAFAQILAINAVRPLARLRIWSPNAERRRDFVEKVRQSLKQTEVVDAATLEAAVADAPIVTIVTRASEPFFPAKLLAPGAHLNAVGAILPGNAEFFPDVFERAKVIAVDDVTNARKASREFIDHFGSDAENWDRVQSLADIVKQGKAREDAGDITLFKAMGMGISDLAIAQLAYARACTDGEAEIKVPLSATAAPIRLKTA